jgi:hypothetical protein
MFRRICASVLVTALTLVLAPSVSADELPPPVVEEVVELAPPPVDYEAVHRWLRVLPPDTLIRIAFEGTGAAERMLAIARRESGLGKRGPGVPFDPACSAKNPRSSASGLFQTLRFWEGRSGWWPGVAHYGFSWAEIEGPDCYADVMIARAIWEESGFGPWT